MTQAPTPQELFRASEQGEADDFAALGDNVNIAARLGSEAEAGEVIVSAVAASAANLETDALQRRQLTLKDRTEPVDTFVLARPS